MARRQIVWEQPRDVRVLVWFETAVELKVSVVTPAHATDAARYALSHESLRFVLGPDAGAEVLAIGPGSTRRVGFQSYEELDPIPEFVETRFFRIPTDSASLADFVAQAHATLECTPATADDEARGRFVRDMRDALDQCRAIARRLDKAGEADAS